MSCGASSTSHAQLHDQLDGVTFLDAPGVGQRPTDENAFENIFNRVASMAQILFAKTLTDSNPKENMFGTDRESGAFNAPRSC